MNARSVQVAGGRWVFVTDPPPKPISAARWTRVAARHKLQICFDLRCVSTPAAHGEFICEFWGEGWNHTNVGALVLDIAQRLEALADRPE